jgi:hypothetical protein
MTWRCRAVIERVVALGFRTHPSAGPGSWPGGDAAAWPWRAGIMSGRRGWGARPVARRPPGKGHEPQDPGRRRGQPQPASRGGPPPAPAYPQPGIASFRPRRAPPGRLLTLPPGTPAAPATRPGSTRSAAYTTSTAYQPSLDRKAEPTASITAQEGRGTFPRGIRGCLRCCPRGRGRSASCRRRAPQGR